MRLLLILLGVIASFGCGYAVAAYHLPVMEEEVRLTLTPDLIRGLDEYSAIQLDRPSRREAVREIVADYLRLLGYTAFETPAPDENSQP